MVKLGLEPNKFFLATFHRNENVTDSFTLCHLLAGLELIGKEFDIPVICPLHPKTRTNLEKFKIGQETKYIKFVSPLGFFDFVNLEMNAKCIISDSGTCPEEGAILHTPSVMIRNTTERPELLQCGSSILSGTYSSNILEAVRVILNCGNNWETPLEYKVSNVSEIVTKILLGNTKNVY